MKTHSCFKNSVRLAPILVALLSPGCQTAHILEIEHNELSETFGDVSNRQLLLNLARLSQNEPAYFIQLGTFESQATVTGTTSLGPETYGWNIDPLGSHAGFSKTAGLSGTLGGTISESPIFNFVPLTGDVFAKIFLTPISDQTVCDFLTKMNYYPDVIIRTMVHSIEIKSKDGSVEFLNNEPLDDNSYAKFIVLCHELTEAKKFNRVAFSAGGAPNKQATLTMGTSELALSSLIKDATVKVADAPEPDVKPFSIKLLPRPVADADEKAFLVKASARIEKNDIVKDLHKRRLDAATKRAKDLTGDSDPASPKVGAPSPTPTPPPTLTPDPKKPTDETKKKSAKASAARAQQFSDMDAAADALVKDAVTLYKSRSAASVDRSLIYKDALLMVQNAERILAATDADDSGVGDLRDRLADLYKLFDGTMQSDLGDLGVLCGQINRLMEAALIMDQDSAATDPEREGREALSVDSSSRAIYSEAIQHLIALGNGGNESIDYPIIEEVFGDPTKTCVFHMRTLEGILYAAASEERKFKDLRREVAHPYNKKIFSHDSRLSFSTYSNESPDSTATTIDMKFAEDESRPQDNAIAYVTGRDPSGGRFEFKCRPILSLDTYDTPFKLVELSYHGHDYMVGDRPMDSNETWDLFSNVTPSMTNRNVFTILAYLFGKASLEPDKLPIQQLIQTTGH